jgi:hypothetical protein
MKSDEETSHTMKTLWTRKPRSQLSTRETSAVRRVRHDEALGHHRFQTAHTSLVNHRMQRTGAA